MFLSDFIGKSVYADGKYHGVCDGIFLSLKTCALRYLSCHSPAPVNTSFCVPYTQVDYVTDTVRLKKFTVGVPIGCGRFLLGSPVYDENGVFLGNASDMLTDGKSAIAVLLDNGKRIPASVLSSFHDAVILRKVPPYPLSQPVPAPSFSYLDDKDKTPFVTKKTLRNAAKQGNLIKFTLSLSPFSFPL